MNGYQESTPAELRHDAWSAYQLFSLYRLLLATGFVLNITPLHFDWLIISQPTLFMVVSYSYLIMSLLSLWGAIAKWPQFPLQINLALGLDLCCLLALMHAAGGISSGVGMLLVIVVAARSLLLPGKTAILVSLITAFILSLEYLNHQPILLTTQSILLGVTLIVTALVTHMIARRIYHHAHLIFKQNKQIETYHQINEHIVKALEVGIIVIDQQSNVRLINEAAKQLLGISHQQIEARHHLPVTFLKYLNTFQGDALSPSTIQVSPGLPDICCEIKYLHADAQLIFINNVQNEAKKVEALKLSALGRLTANIAHEIRNPLGALSHASQLLAEQPLNDQNMKLTSMIMKNSNRINDIVNNVLSLSRQQQAHLKEIEIVAWLKQFIQETSFGEDAEINFEIKASKHMVQVDPTQLQQILVNLIENGIRYSHLYTGERKVILNLSLHPEKNALYLDVIDFGEGVSAKDLKRMYEPFYSTSQDGSGLGLYMAKTLCQLNSAQLEYQRAPTNGAQFRITFTLLQSLNTQ